MMNEMTMSRAAFVAGAGAAAENISQYETNA